MSRFTLLTFNFILILLLPRIALTAPFYGARFSYAAVAKEPTNLKGYQFTLFYYPQKFQWRKFNVYFDGGFSHFLTNSDYYSSINIYSIAPVIHYTFRKRGPILPFLEFSIGLAYLNRTRLEERNLGIHFAFQDRLGIGASLGQAEQLSLGVHAVHYSNAHLSSHNSGISVPLMADIGYRFN